MNKYQIDKRINSSEKSMDYIQNIIERMSQKSSNIKKFTISLLTAAIAFVKVIHVQNVWIIFLVDFLVFYLCIWDAYYLKLERDYRDLFDLVKNYANYKSNEYVPYDLSPKNYSINHKVSKTFLTTFSLSTYFIILIFINIIYFFVF